MHIELLHGPTQTIARCALGAGETLVAEAGAMVGMSGHVQLQTSAGGGLAALKRAFGGETLFRNRFFASRPGEVLLAPSLRGDLGLLEVGSTQWMLQRGAFVASTPGVEIETRASARGFLSGMGLLLLETQGQGDLVVGSFGVMEAIDLDGPLVVDSGHLVAWDRRIPHEVTKASRGWVGAFLSGEGFVVRFEGRGRIWIQTRNSTEYGARVGRLLPPREA